MPLSPASITVGTAATLLSTTDRAGTANGQAILVKVPAGGQVVYIGGANVTTTTGYPLAAGETLSLDIEGDDVVYGIVAATTQAVNVLRTGV